MKRLGSLFLALKVRKGSTRTRVTPEPREVKVGAGVAEDVVEAAGVMGERGVP